ncbi:MAG: manganese efflux pump MntP family protein [Thermodesulfovibrionales bacterium]
MDIFTVLFVALGLSMDAFAVSVTSGFTIHRLRARHALRIAFFFGSFQAVMPVIGWSLGLGFRELISGVDHWVAFGLLSAIGAKMIYESRKLGVDERRSDPLNIYVLTILSIATSIDALAVGLSLSVLRVPIVNPALVIGLVTFLVCLAGVYIGDRVGHFFEKKIELAGGVVLIGIGVKILLEHMG